MRWAIQAERSRPASWLCRRGTLNEGETASRGRRAFLFIFLFSGFFYFYFEEGARAADMMSSGRLFPECLFKAVFRHTRGFLLNEAHVFFV